ncbi:MAG: TlyA family RNA methyltransferase [Dehalococcoidia bacterium]
MPKQRVDQLLVDRGLAPSRARARALLLAGRVRGKDRLYTTPGQALSDDIELEVAPGRAFVSRGGEKLLAALESWPLSVVGRVCLDIGASTGGFSDCLLQHGAARVYAVDVGYGQLDQSLRRDPRVVVMERQHARGLPPLDPAPSLVTMDVSFISARALLPAAAGAAAPAADIIVLVKPQFEAGRDKVGKGGVVRRPGDRAAAVGAVAVWARDRGWRLGGVLRSPLRGPAGNEEYLLWLRIAAAPRQRDG